MLKICGTLKFNQAKNNLTQETLDFFNSFQKINLRDERLQNYLIYWKKFQSESEKFVNDSDDEFNNVLIIQGNDFYYKNSKDDNNFRVQIVENFDNQVILLENDDQSKLLDLYEFNKMRMVNS